MLSWWIVGLLLLIITGLLLKIWLLKRSMNEVSSGIQRQLASETNTLLRTSSRDKQVRQLIVDLNKQLRLLRHERQHYLSGNRELTDSVTNISHDLRTPLTAICGYLDLLEAEEHSVTTARYLKVVSNRVEALKQLTEELFRYSVTISSDKPQIEEVVINDLLAESVANFYEAFKEKGLEPEIKLPVKKVRRQLNRAYLVRIFANLLENALHYSDGDLTICLTEVGEVSFVNQASQLNEIEVGKLFDRFYTVETARKSTGLGLAIVKHLVEEMDGELVAEYGEGKLTVRVLLAEK